MQFVKPDVVTPASDKRVHSPVLLAGRDTQKALCTAQCAYSYSSAWLSGLGGQATTSICMPRKLLRMRTMINKLLSQHSGQPLDRIEKDGRAGFHHESRTAKDYGMIDEIIYKHR